jgi:hypothetical protein
MNKYKLIILFWDTLPQSTINQFYKSLDYLKKLTPNYSKLMILDLTSFSMRKIKNNYIHKDGNVEYIKPVNLNDLKKIKNLLKKYKKVYVIGPVHSDFKSFFIFLILRWLDLKIIFINYFGYYLSEKNFINFKFIYKLKRFFQLRFWYYLSTILSQLSIFPKIEFYFETSKERILSMENTFFKRIKNKIYFLNFKNSKILRINSKYYDELKVQNENNLNENFIVLVDSGYDHPDRLKIEKTKDEKKHDLNKKKYYENLFRFMKLLEKIYQNRIIFCQHPKTNYALDNHFKKIEENFEITKGQTDKFIKKGGLVVFTGPSSMVNKAIILKKKILYSISNGLGLHDNDKVLFFVEKMKLPIINLDNFTSLDKNLIDLQIKESMKLYDPFIMNNLISQENVFSYDQIKEIIYK